MRAVGNFCNLWINCSNPLISFFVRLRLEEISSFIICYRLNKKIKNQITKVCSFPNSSSEAFTILQDLRRRVIVQSESLSSWVNANMFLFVRTIKRLLHKSCILNWTVFMISVKSKNSFYIINLIFRNIN